MAWFFVRYFSFLCLTLQMSGPKDTQNKKYDDLLENDKKSSLDGLSEAERLRALNGEYGQDSDDHDERGTGFLSRTRR